MIVSTDFIGANIDVLEIRDNTVYVNPQLRDTTVDWFYWAFCVEGAAGQTWTFDFGDKSRVGYFGPAISYDLKSWKWAGSQETNKYSSFTYQFGENENRVYFAHDLLYHPDRFYDFLAGNGVTSDILAYSENGRAIDMVEFGEGDNYIILTARHHCCESTGSYVLEGALKELLREPIKGYRICAVPFMDIDGVINGDQGKCRHPYDHNRDYVENPIYKSTKALMDYAKNKKVRFLFDLHSPWHFGSLHNTCHMVYANEKMNERYRNFGNILEGETSGDEQSLKYMTENNLEVNMGWNKGDAPTCAKYFSGFDGTELSFTLEIPYFGTSSNQVSDRKLVRLGENLAGSIRLYIKKYT